METRTKIHLLQLMKNDFMTQLCQLKGFNYHNFTVKNLVVILKSNVRDLKCVTKFQNESFGQSKKGVFNF